MSEVVSCFVAQFLGLNIIPDTLLKTYFNEEGSLQIFVKGLNFEEYKKKISEKIIQKQVLYDNNFKKLFYTNSEIVMSAVNGKLRKEMPVLEFQKLVVLDFILGNLDRKDDNWFVSVRTKSKYLKFKQIEDKIKRRIKRKEKIEALCLIDHGNTFPEKNPETYLASRNQYLWKEHPLSHEIFENDTKEFIKQAYEKKDDLIRLIHNLFPNYLRKGMQELLEERMDVLYFFACKNKDERYQTPYHIAKYRKEQDFIDLRKSLEYSEFKRSNLAFA